MIKFPILLLLLFSVAAGTSFRDEFTSSLDTLTNPPWKLNNYGQWTAKISASGGYAKSNEGAGGCYAIYSTDCETYNQRMKITLVSVSSLCYAAVICRWNYVTKSGYAWGKDADNIVLSVVINGTATPLATVATSYSEYDSIDVVAIGDSIFGYKNNIRLAAVRNTMVTGYGVGFFTYDATQNIDNAAGGDTSTCTPATAANPSNVSDTTGNSFGINLGTTNPFDSIKIVGGIDTMWIPAGTDSLKGIIRWSYFERACSVYVYSCASSIPSDTIRFTITGNWINARADSIMRGSMRLSNHDSIYTGDTLTFRYFMHGLKSFTVPSHYSKIDSSDTSARILVLHNDTVYPGTSANRVFAMCDTVGCDTFKTSGTIDTLRYIGESPPPDSSSITVRDTVGGTVSLDPAGGRYEVGDTVKIFYSDTGCYSFSAWGDSIADSIGDTVRYVVTADDITVGATFTINVPVAVSGPSNDTPCTGTQYVDTAHFTCATSFQWQTDWGYGGDPYWSNIGGAIDSIFFYGPILASHSGYRFRCIGTNSSGSDTSAESEIKIDSFSVALNSDAHAPITRKGDSIFACGEACTTICAADSGYAASMAGRAYKSFPLLDTMIWAVTADSTVASVAAQIPVIDSIKRPSGRRDKIRVSAARVGDTIRFYLSTDIGDSTESSTVWVARDTSGEMPLIAWYNSASGVDSIDAVVPMVTLNKNYRPIVRSGLGVYSEVRTPVTWTELWVLLVKGWSR